MKPVPVVRACAALALAVALGVTAVPLSVDAALPATGGAPAVCAYLGIINGTRAIDPDFTAGGKPAPPSAATPSPSLGAGGALSAVSANTVGTTSGTAAPASTSNYCHALPPFVPVGGNAG